MNSGTILELLRTKHSGDVFVSECKTGATWFGNYLILDAWTMKKSWAKPLVTGYEIKVDRRDFVADDKWQNYLPYCNEFYFVCPAGVIDPSELPAEAGLLIVSKNCKILYTKKKSARRMDIQIPEDIFRYILMNRVMISSIEERLIRTRISNKAYWEEWLKEKQVNWDFGNMVSKSIAETVKNKVLEVKRENDRLTEKNAKLQEIKEFLERLGIDFNEGYIFGWKERIREKIEMVNKGIPSGNLTSYISETIELLTKVKEIFLKEENETTRE